MTYNLLKVLTNARAAIARPEWWAKGYLHTSVPARIVMSDAPWLSKDDPEATCHCMMGAVEVADPDLNFTHQDYHSLAAHPAFVALVNAFPSGWYPAHGGIKRNWVPTFNDDKNVTHEMVMAVFDQAIATEAARLALQRT